MSPCGHSETAKRKLINRDSDTKIARAVYSNDPRLRLPDPPTRPFIPPYTHANIQRRRIRPYAARGAQDRGRHPRLRIPVPRRGSGGEKVQSREWRYGVGPGVGRAGGVGAGSLVIREEVTSLYGGKQL